jgi:hypothetical protein
MLSTVEFVKRMLDVAAERGESAVVKFEVRPRICSQQCRGFHKSNYFRFNPDGTVEFQPSPYGFHSVVYPTPRFEVVEFDDAVRIIDHILREQEIVEGRRGDLEEMAEFAERELAYMS